MNQDVQRRVQRYGWDKAASFYEPYWHRQLKPAQDRLIEVAELQPRERVLDIACGTGLVSFPAASTVGPDGEVIGVDISDEMVHLAGRIAKERGIDNATFERMDARVASDVCPLFFQLGTGDALAHVFRSAGFSEVTSDRFSTILRYETAEDVCAAAFEAGPVAIAFGRFDEGTRNASREAYLASVETFKNGGRFEIPGEFVVTKGYKSS